MIFLVNTFFVAMLFYSVVALANQSADIPIRYLHLDNSTELVDYASQMEDHDCFPFNPTMKRPIDVSNFDSNTLYELMKAYASGSQVEMCVPKNQRNLRGIELRGWSFWSITIIVMN
jgi:hypothetical protein